MPLYLNLPEVILYTLHVIGLDRRMQFLMIPLERQNVVTTAIDDLPGDLLLATDAIDCNDRFLDRDLVN